MSFFKKYNNLNKNEIYLSKTKLADNIYLYYNNTNTQTTPCQPFSYKKCHDKIQCKDGQYIEIHNKLYKLNYIEIKYNKIIYYFEYDIILEIIEAKNNRIIYNLFNLSKSHMLFVPQTVDFIQKDMIKKYNLLSTNDNIELDLIYKLIKLN
jgi:hypothetical protein